MTGTPNNQGGQKRVRIYTVHGTFDHAAPWDNWDINDDKSKPSRERHFVNRLSDELADLGVTFEQVDHSEYNWSGGNSHDERRTAAIGLKKRIEMDLSGFRSPDGRGYKDYYNGGVFVIGHSHGGTLSRLAMNLWDKRDEFFKDKPDAGKLEHDGKCLNCKQMRNGNVGPNAIDRPDGVITFGSPFVHFKERKMGLLTLRILAWTAMILGLLALAAYFAVSVFQQNIGQEKLDSDAIEKTTQLWSILQFAWPLICFWVFALYIPGRVTAWVAHVFGKERGKLFLTSLLAKTIKIVGTAALVTYYAIAIHSNSWAVANNWIGALPTFGVITHFWTWFPIVAFWVVAISLPSRFLKWLSGHVSGLRTSLRDKYDPEEDPDNATRYLSFHTPGDEAGLHLRIFGILTWIVQTLWLTAGVVIAVGVFAILASVIIGLTGISSMELVPVWNLLMTLPVIVNNTLYAPITGEFMEFLDPSKRPGLTEFYPLALVGIALIILVFLMPTVLIVIIGAYLLAIWLRGSGLVFGSERFAWTLANNISANIRPGRNAMMKRVIIAPEAWWNSEMAHCYFYKSDRVIRDVAANIADWRNTFVASNSMPIGAVLSQILRWLVALFFGLSIFMVTANIQFKSGKPETQTPPASFSSETPTEPHK